MNKYAQVNFQSKLRQVAYLCYYCYQVKLSYYNKAWKFKARGSCDDNGSHGDRLCPAASEETVRRAGRDRAVFPRPPEHDGPHQRAPEKVRLLHTKPMDFQTIAVHFTVSCCFSSRRLDNTLGKPGIFLPGKGKHSHIKYTFKMHE